MKSKWNLLVLMAALALPFGAQALENNDHNLDCWKLVQAVKDNPEILKEAAQQEVVQESNSAQSADE